MKTTGGSGLKPTEAYPPELGLEVALLHREMLRHGPSHFSGDCVGCDGEGGSDHEDSSSNNSFSCLDDLICLQ
eukprot:555641-Pyramimonas_sp.AAC.1